jgi:hypothetical protein
MHRIQINIKDTDYERLKAYAKGNYETVAGYMRRLAFQDMARAETERYKGVE